jgi:hypothetical protein
VQRWQGLVSSFLAALDCRREAGRDEQAGRRSDRVDEQRARGGGRERDSAPSEPASVAIVL